MSILYEIVTRQMEADWQMQMCSIPRAMLIANSTFREESHRLVKSLATRPTPHYFGFWFDRPVTQNSRMHQDGKFTMAACLSPRRAYLTRRARVETNMERRGVNRGAKAGDWTDASVNTNLGFSQETGFTFWKEP